MSPRIHVRAGKCGGFLEFCPWEAEAEFSGQAGSLNKLELVSSGFSKRPYPNRVKNSTYVLVRVSVCCDKKKTAKPKETWGIKS